MAFGQLAPINYFADYVAQYRKSAHKESPEVNETFIFGNTIDILDNPRK